MDPGSDQGLRRVSDKPSCVPLTCPFFSNKKAQPWGTEMLLPGHCPIHPLVDLPFWPHLLLDSLPDLLPLVASAEFHLVKSSTTKSSHSVSLLQNASPSYRRDTITPSYSACSALQNDPCTLERLQLHTVQRGLASIPDDLFLGNGRLGRGVDTSSGSGIGGFSTPPSLIQQFRRTLCGEKTENSCQETKVNI